VEGLRTGVGFHVHAPSTMMLYQSLARHLCPRCAPRLPRCCPVVGDASVSIAGIASLSQNEIRVRENNVETQNWSRIVSRIQRLPNPRVPGRMREHGTCSLGLGQVCAGPGSLRVIHLAPGVWHTGTRIYMAREYHIWSVVNEEKGKGKEEDGCRRRFTSNIVPHNDRPL
jgi:hypothetical protein